MSPIITKISNTFKLHSKKWGHVVYIGLGLWLLGSKPESHQWCASKRMLLIQSLAHYAPLTSIFLSSNNLSIPRRKDFWKKKNGCRSTHAMGGTVEWLMPNWCLSWFVFSWCSLIEKVINKIYTYNTIH